MTRAFALAALLGLLGAAPAAQDSSQSGDAATRRAAERLRALQQEADRLATESRTLIGDLRKLEIERELLSEELAQITAKSQAVTSELANVKDSIARIESEDLQQRPELEARLVELYKLGQGRYWRILLGMSDLQQIGHASRLVASVAQADRDRLASHKQRRDTLRTARQRLEADSREVDKLRADAARAKAASDQAVAARAQAIRRIDTERDLNAQLTSELQAAQQKLQLTLRTVGSAAPASALPMTPFRGAIDWPVAGKVAQAFGRAVGGRPAQNGIQIAAPLGMAVRVVHGGTVAFTGPFTGFGNLVILDHGNDAFSLYGNLREVTVKQGASLQAGDVLGTTGTPPAGPADASGLYFELRIDGRPVDPLQWLKKP
jgi:septal ring factor EnvC (AmiA/AmiB activator)